tara:strand:- start:1605 stop:2096 length:492 start_codon:yes stop_codon:yes gene_type:complete
MIKTTPKSHLFRLAGVLVLFAVAFLLVKSWATPDSWNFEQWYRGDALIDIAAQPLTYGGNESCKDCHQAAIKKLRKFDHKALSCESCHGPVVDHVKGQKKIAKAIVDKSRWQCENCHDERINRPKGFPQFSQAGEIGKSIKKHKDLEAETPCLKCHDAHDPTP